MSDDLPMPSNKPKYSLEQFVRLLKRELKATPSSICLEEDNEEWQTVRRPHAYRPQEGRTRTYLGSFKPYNDSWASGAYLDITVASLREHYEREGSSLRFMPDPVAVWRPAARVYEEGFHIDCKFIYHLHGAGTDIKMIQVFIDDLAHSIDALLPEIPAEKRLLHEGFYPRLDFGNYMPHLLLEHDGLPSINERLSNGFMDPEQRHTFPLKFKEVGFRGMATVYTFDEHGEHDVPEQMKALAERLSYFWLNGWEVSLKKHFKVHGL